MTPTTHDTETPDLFASCSISSAQEDHIQREFEAFDRENPHVYELFKALALKARAAGRQRYGAASIFEVLRWSMTVETRGDQFKLNNNYRSRFARKLVSEDPELWGDFFQLRRLRAGEGEDED